MRRARVLVPALPVGITSVLAAHDLFLTLASYFVPANAGITIVGRTSTGARRTTRHLVTDARGEVAVPPRPPGPWYVKLIRMTRGTRAGIDYVSHWAPLTFAVAPAGKAP